MGEVTFSSSGAHTALYVDPQGGNDEIEFVYDTQKRVFVAWLTESPRSFVRRRLFVMVPVMDGDKLVGLDVIPHAQSHLSGFVAHFVLDIPRRHSDASYDDCA